MDRYKLHYAPDNASLIVRLVLEELHIPYDLALVDRRANAQHGAAYKLLNPVGRIPALETPHGPLFETAAICLWLSDTYRDGHHLSPGPQAATRGSFLSWLFFLSNTVHAELRTLFYTNTVAGPDPVAQTAVSRQTQANLARHFDMIDATCAHGPHFSADQVSICGLYLAPLLRWCALYPLHADKSWIQLGRWPALKTLAQRIEHRASAVTVATSEGLGPTPFSRPRLPNPPEGSAL